MVILVRNKEKAGRASRFTGPHSPVQRQPEHAPPKPPLQPLHVSLHLGAKLAPVCSVSLRGIGFIAHVDPGGVVPCETSTVSISSSVLGSAFQLRVRAPARVR